MPTLRAESPSRRPEERVTSPPCLRQVPEEARGGDRPPLTALVTCFNEQHNIASCLSSLQWCDEILVVDSYSTDATVAVARSFPRVRVVQHRYYGGAAQKNWAIERCRHDWILVLDADERMTPKLRREIEDTLAESPAPAAYSIPRRTFFLERPVRYSGWQNDRVTRLFHRAVARYPNRRVHADMRTLEPAVALEQPMDHHMIQDLREYADRVNRYAFWGAAQLWRENRRARLAEVVIRPTWRFLRTFVLQRGALEGTMGLILCLLQSWGCFLKWSTLWGWQQSAARGQQPDLPEFDDDDAIWTWPPAARPTEHPTNGRNDGPLPVSGLPLAGVE